MRTTCPKSHSTVQRLGLNPRSPIASPTPQPQRHRAKTSQYILISVSVYCLLCFFWCCSFLNEQLIMMTAATEYQVTIQSSDTGLRCRVLACSHWNTVQMPSGSGGLNGGRWRPPPPPIGSDFFLKKLRFPVWKAYTCSSLCAFAINDDGTDAVSSAAPFSKFLDPPLASGKMRTADLRIVQRVKYGYG